MKLTELIADAIREGNRDGLTPEQIANLLEDQILDLLKVEDELFPRYKLTCNPITPFDITWRYSYNADGTVRIEHVGPFKVKYTGGDL